MSIDLKAAVPPTADSTVREFGAIVVGVDEPAVLGTAVPTTVDTAHIAWRFCDATCDSVHVTLTLS